MSAIRTASISYPTGATASRAAKERTKTSLTGSVPSLADSHRSGYTLIEVLVVLILMGLAAALVMPALTTHRAAPQPSFAALVQNARAAAARRGELVYLGISSTGNWRLDGAASPEQGPFATGRLSDYRGPTATLVVSPIGTCGFDSRSATAAQAIPLDPLTCEVRIP